MFWSLRYKGYYIHGATSMNQETVTALCSPSGFGYTWKKDCKSLHAAKLAITKHIKEAA